jgi:hypothetical protein
MWVAKGSLFGVGIFVGTVLLYCVIRLGLIAYQVAQAAKSVAHGGAVPAGSGAAYDIRGYVPMIVHNPYVWIALLGSLAVGLWLAKR